MASIALGPLSYSSVSGFSNWTGAERLYRTATSSTAAASSSTNRSNLWYNCFDSNQIPSDATIVGVALVSNTNPNGGTGYVGTSAPSTGSFDINIYLYNGTSYSSSLYSNTFSGGSQRYPATQGSGEILVGGATDLVGLTWDVADQANFGFRIDATDHTGTVTGVAIRGLELEVYYTLPASPTPTPSITPTITPTITQTPTPTPSVNNNNIYSIDDVSFSSIDEINGTNISHIYEINGINLIGPAPSPSVTPTISVTPSITPSVTPTISVTPSVTVTPTISITPSITATPTISVTPSVTITPTISVTPSVTVTPTISITPSVTVTPTISVTPSVTVTPTISITPSITATPTISVTPSVTVTPSISITPSITPTPSSTSSGSSPISISNITVTDDYGTLSTTIPHVCNLPSGATSGDFVLILWTIDDPTGGLTQTPSGWTKANGTAWGNSTSDAHIVILYKQLDGTEGSSVDCYSNLSSTRGSIFYSMIVNNIDLTTPIDALGTPKIAGNGTQVITNAVNSIDGGIFICVVAFDGADGDPFTFSNGSFTFTDGGNTGNSGQTTGGVSSAFKYATIDASTSTSTTTITAQTTDGKVAGHIILKQG